KRFQERINSGYRHGGYGEEKRELKRGRAGHAHQLSGRNRGHGTRGAGEDGGENLAGADPDGLAAVDVVHFPGVNGRTGRTRPGFLPRRFHGVDDPHDDASDQQRSAHHVETLEVFADHFGQQKRWTGGYHERNHNQAQGVSQDRAIPFFAFRKRRKELG